MHHQRHLGVEEGNAIDDIVTYEMKKARHADGPEDYIAYCKACQLLGIQRSASTFVHPAFSGNSKALVKKHDQVLPYSYMFGPILPSRVYHGMATIMAWFGAWLLGCALLYGVGWLLFQILSSAVQGFTHTAYP